MKSITSIGILGYGQFGKFIHSLLQQYTPHLSVDVYDPKLDNGSLEKTLQADLIFLAVPIRYFEEIIVQIKLLLNPTSILFELCTVKEHPLRVLQDQLPDHHYIATHPMFGPYSYQKVGSLKDLRLVIADHTLPEATYDNLKRLFGLLQLKTIEMSAEEHDKLLARSLFLTHFITQSVIQAELVRTDIDTVSFGNLMDVVESVRNDKELFRDVRTHNAHCQEILERFQSAQDEVIASLTKQA